MEVFLNFFKNSLDISFSRVYYIKEDLSIRKTQLLRSVSYKITREWSG